MTTTTHTTDEHNAQELEKQLNDVINNLDKTIADINITAGKLDTLDKDLDEADEMITNISDDISDFEEGKRDEIDSLVLDALREEEDK